MKLKIILSVFLGLLFKSLISQVWIQKNGIPGNGRANPESFSINGMGYVALGSTTISGTSPMYNDLWQYNPSMDSWTQKASLPVTGRAGSIGFSFQNMGYLGLGANNGTSYNDIFQYDPSVDIWTLETIYPGNGGRNPFFICNDSSLFVGGGNNGFSGPYQDFWRYDFHNSSWTSLGNLYFGNRSGGVSFRKDSLLFFGLGSNGTSSFNDFWAYNLRTNQWFQLPLFPGLSRIQATVINLGTKLLIGGGHQLNTGIEFSDYYEFDLQTLSWGNQHAFKHGRRSLATSFCINNKSYISCGNDSANNVLRDLWEVSFVSTNVNDIKSKVSSVSVYPNPAKEFVKLSLEEELFEQSMFTLFDASGRVVLNKLIISKDDYIDLSKISGGIHFYTIQSKQKRESSGKILILAK